MKIAIDGMHCQACVLRVRKALEKVNGVHVKEVLIGSAELDIVDPKSDDLGSALAAIETAGYTPHVPA